VYHRKQNPAIMRITITIILTFLLISCLNRNNQNNQEIDDPKISDISDIIEINEISKSIDGRFEEFLSALEPLVLPHQFECYDFNDQDLLEKLSETKDTIYSEKWDIPYKRIIINEQFESAIFLSPADIYIPVLKTFNLNGDLISELQLMTSCGQEPGFFSRQFVTIEPSLEIIRIDSTWRCEVNNQGIEDKSTEKLEVTTERFKINKVGEIIEF